VSALPEESPSSATQRVQPIAFGLRKSAELEYPSGVLNAVRYGGREGARLSSGTEHTTTAEQYTSLCSALPAQPLQSLALVPSSPTLLAIGVIMVEMEGPEQQRCTASRTQSSQLSVDEAAHLKSSAGCLVCVETCYALVAVSTLGE
jgi:hypothetical protein